MLNAEIIFLIADIDNEAADKLFILNDFNICLFRAGFLANEFFYAHKLLIIRGINAENLCRGNIIFFIYFRNVSFDDFFKIIDFALLCKLQNKILNRGHKKILSHLCFILGGHIRIIKNGS